jgi:hypothetical protein
MWWFAIGDLPPGVDAEEPEWTRQVVAWCKGYLEFCCDPPLLGYYVDGIATEDEIAEGTSISGEMPLGMALFYDDGMEEEAAHYLDKCHVAYYHFCTAVDWVACHPTALLALFERLGYDISARVIGPREPPGHRAPIALGSEAFQEALRVIDAANNDDGKLDLVRLPPMLEESDPHWSDWVVNWIDAYLASTCGAPPSGTRLKRTWDSSTRWGHTQGRPHKVQCGWGLDWDGGEPPPQTRDFAEKFRVAFYRLLTHVDWQQFDGTTLRSCFDEQGYNDYLGI